MADLDKRSFGREEGKCLVCVGSEENGERDKRGRKHGLLQEVLL